MVVAAVTHALPYCPHWADLHRPDHVIKCMQLSCPLACCIYHASPVKEVAVA